MFIRPYFNHIDGSITFSRQQASCFAKQIADDFNPLHDVNAKRFCVPGDLLFSVLLAKAGLHQTMKFNFVGMVTDEHQLTFPETLSPSAAVKDENGKEFVKVYAHGDRCRNQVLIEALTKAYVGFSGQTFPHILVDLMQQHQVMINPARPMIMYESMEIELNSFDADSVALVLSDARLDIDGKRGSACLQFNLLSGDKIIGNGKKHMLLSGLRPYCQQTIDNIVATYIQAKQDYQPDLVN